MKTQLCLVYANCQNNNIASHLRKSQIFNQEYSIKRFSVHLMNERGLTVPDELLKQAKLFIYQPVKDTNGERSSNYLLSKLSSNCQRISFPSLYFTGYFPQLL